jgi:hypothetical protein
MSNASSPDDHPIASSRHNAADRVPVRSQRATQSATRTATNTPAIDPELMVVAESWHRLPAPIKAGILAMIKSAVKD